MKETSLASCLAMKKSREQKMLFCNCVCAWHPVRVVHGVSGHIRSLSRPMTVGELLRTHPHHFVCEPTPTGPLFHTGMLPSDMELEEGRIYLLLPLPRLLPHLTSSASASGSLSHGSFSNPNPPSCPCFTASHNTGLSPKATDSGIGGRHSQPDAQCDTGLVDGRFLLRMRAWRNRVAQSRLLRSLVGAGRRMVPERLFLFRFSLRRSVEGEHGGLGLKYSSGSKSVGASSPAVQSSSCSGRNRWRPGLERISEVDLLTGLLKPDNNHAPGD